MKTGNIVKLKSGFGYWDITNYPIGGNFHRCGSNGLMITITRRFDSFKGSNAEGLTADNKKIAFNIQNSIEIETACPDCGKTADHLWNSGKYDENGDIFICDDCCKYWGGRMDKADLINRSDW